MINCIDHVGYRTPISIKEKTLYFDIVNFWKCHTVLQRKAHLISVYKLNKAENQEDKSKMFQIFKVGIYQLHIIGAKIHATKISRRPLSEKKVKKLGGRKFDILVNEKDRIWFLSFSLSFFFDGRHTMTTGNFSLHYFNLFCPTEALASFSALHFSINNFISKT